MTIELGAKVRDTISGFEGIVVSRTEYLHGVTRCDVEGSFNVKEGKFQNGWFEESRLIVLEHA